MLRLIISPFLSGERRQNLLAAITLAIVVLIFQINTDPEACGGNPIGTHPRKSPQLLVSMATPVPVQTASIQQALDEVVAINPHSSSDQKETESTPKAPSATTPDAPATADIVLPQGKPLQGKEALQASRWALIKGKEYLQRVPDYKAILKRQERIDGSLLDPQEITLKVRHEPFSLYMKWTEGDKGRQLIYVKGLHDDQVLVQPGGLTGRLTGALQMPPNDPRVLAESRYPATCAGLLELSNLILRNHETDLQHATGVQCEMCDGQSFDERPCYLTSIVYDNPSVCKNYHKSLILIDQELSVPVCVRNYTWVEGKPAAEDNDDNLIESYSYSGLEINLELSDNDFEKSKYRMR